MTNISFKLNGCWCFITKEDDVYVTTGRIGNNIYSSLAEVLQGLQGFNINIDNLFFEN